MSEQHEVTTFWRRVVLDDESNERCQPEKSIAQVQRHKGFRQRFASVMALFTALAIVGVGWMVVFAGLLVGYPKKLKGLLDARQLVKRRQDSRLGTPDVTTLPGSYRGSDDVGGSPGAAEVSGYHGSLDSPSWPFNRLCG
jgi:hypothetical protein